jgi:hypothetical protein
MDISELLQLHNNYCDAVNGFDDYIYSMDDLNELCSGQDAFWITCRVFYGEFNPNDDYLTFNGYGNFISFNEWKAKDYIYTDDIIDYIIDNNDSLYNDEIQDLLDEYEAINESEDDTE